MFRFKTTGNLEHCSVKTNDIKAIFIMLQIKTQIGIYLFIFSFLALNYLDRCSNLGYELESPRELF